MIRAFCKRYTRYAHAHRFNSITVLKKKRLTVRELRHIVKELKNAGVRFRGLYAFRFGLPTNLKLATCAAISEGTPQVPLLVGMSLLLLAAQARLSGVSGILRNRFPPTADRASIADRLLRSCCASISGVRLTMTHVHCLMCQVLAA